jgi:hypothetical protein
MEEVLKLEFLTDINYIRLFINIIILFACTRLIEYTYGKYSFSNDNKPLFTKHLFNFTISIFLIVSVVKSSIALSLGLVGALSIIRFRTAIKEPGQLITLLILTALSISMAAEKEVLGIIITFIYYLNSIVVAKRNSLNKNSSFENSKILRVSMKENSIKVSDLVKINNIERIYNDVNKVIHPEFIINSKENELESILEKLKSYGEIISYEFL